MQSDKREIFFPWHGGIIFPQMEPGHAKSFTDVKGTAGNFNVGVLLSDAVGRNLKRKLAVRFKRQHSPPFEF
jgi:hypothetical protein